MAAGRRRGAPGMLLGVTAGLVTAALMIVIWIFWGAGPLAPEEWAVEPADTLPPSPGEPIVDARRVAGALIGPRQAGIAARLRSTQPRTRPLTGPLRLSATRIEWRDPQTGGLFVIAPEVSGRIDLAAATRGDIIINDVVLRRPDVRLVQDARGRWNYEGALAGILEDGPPAADPRRFELRNVRVVDGRVAVTQPEESFTLTALQATAPRVILSDPTRQPPRLTIATISTTLTHPRLAQATPVTARSASVSLPPDRVVFEAEEVVALGTRFVAVAGEWSAQLPGLGFRLAGRVPDADLALLAPYLPDFVPPAGTASLAFTVEPVAGIYTDVTVTDLLLATDGTRATGAFTVRLGPEVPILHAADLRLDPLQLALIEQYTGPLPYAGTLAGTVTGAAGRIDFDLQARLTAPGVLTPFTAQLTGEAAFVAGALDLRLLRADLQAVPLAALEPVAPGLPLRGTVTGTVLVRGMPSEAPLTLDISLQTAMGVALVQGRVDLRGPVAAYDISGRLIGVNLQQLLQPDVPPVSLTADFALAGTGFEPATADATLRLAGRFTGWESAPGDTVMARAAVRGGTLEVDALELRLASLALEAAGEWRFLAPEAGAVQYRLAVADLRPWGPYVPAIGDPLAAGTLLAEGTFSGRAGSIALAGSVSGRGLRFGEWAAGALEAGYSGVLGEARPRLLLEARASGVRTPTAGDFRTARADVRLDPTGFTVDVLAERPGEGVVQLVAEGILPEVGPADIIVQAARFDIDDERWLLVQPATIQWEAVPGIVVSNLEFRDEAGTGRIRVDGRVLPLAQVDATLEADAFPVGRVQRLLGVRPEWVTGALWMSARVVGPGTDPVIEADFRLIEGEIQGMPVASAEGRLRYAGQRLEAEAWADFPEAGQLRAGIELPVVVSFDPDPAVEWLDDGPVRGELVADNLGVAPLAALTPLVRNAQGLIVGRMDLSGTVQDPVLAGNFRVIDAAATFPDINQRYREGNAEIELQGNQIIITAMQARSDGLLLGSGTITFADLRTPVIAAEFQLDNFRALGTPTRRGAAFSGSGRLDGPLIAGPTLSARVFIEDGDVLIPIDPEETTIDFFDPLPGAPAGDPLGPIAVEPTWLEQLRLRNVVATFADNVWFQAFDARVQLGGTLNIERTGELLIITGTLEGTRGQYVLQAGPIVRRFDVTAATVRFVGTGELNPLIDFTAQRRIIDPAGRHLSIDVRITGTAQNPQIALASADAAALPQSELLSILIFGQPSFALGGGGIPGEAVLEQTLVGGLAELAGLELEQAIIQDLGLPVDILQIRFGPGGFGGFGTPQILLGRELTTDVFLTVETALDALFADTEAGPQTWAVRLEWAIDPRQTLRTGFEPVRQARLQRGMRFALPARDPRSQFFLELRRRWYH
jgi:hypothetical protein